MKNLRYLALNNRWRLGASTTYPIPRELSFQLQTSIASCRLLQQIQFRNSWEVPTLAGLGEIAQGCTALRKLQLTVLGGLDGPRLDEGAMLPILFPQLEVLKLGNHLRTTGRVRRLNSLLSLAVNGHVRLPRLQDIELYHPLDDIDAELGSIAPLIRGASLSHPLLRPITAFTAIQTLLITVYAEPAPKIPPLPSVEHIIVKEVPLYADRNTLLRVQSRCEELLWALHSQSWLRLKRVMVYIPTVPNQPPASGFVPLARALASQGIDFAVNPHPLTDPTECYKIAV